MKKYLVNDDAVTDLFITEALDCEYETDGEYVFDTLEEAKEHCLALIDTEISSLQYTRSAILETKETL